MFCSFVAVVFICRRFVEVFICANCIFKIEILRLRDTFHLSFALLCQCMPVDGELLCFPVSGDEADTVGNNHRRFWKTLPHSLTGGMPYNYFPRGRVELRHGKAVVYLHPSLCTPGIDIRIRLAFSLPDEVPLPFKADGNRHYRSIQKEQEG